MLTDAGKAQRDARDQTALNYDYVGAAAFGAAGRAAAVTLQIGELLVASVAVLLLLADNVVELSDGAIEPRRALYVAAATSYALSVSQPDLLAAFSLLSLAVVVAQIAVLVGMGASDPVAAAAAARTTVPATTLDGAMEALGAVMFCFGGHSMLPASFAAMRAPREASAMLRANFAFMALLYVAIGGGGYLIYGAAVHDRFVDDFPPGAWVTRATRVAMAYNLQSTLPLIVAALASYALPPAAAAATGASWLRGAAVKGMLMAAVVAITVGLGDRFGLLVSVGGASLVSSGATPAPAPPPPAAPLVTEPAPRARSVAHPSAGGQPDAAPPAHARARARVELPPPRRVLRLCCRRHHARAARAGLALNTRGMRTCDARDVYLTCGLVSKQQRSRSRPYVLPCGACALKLHPAARRTAARRAGPGRGRTASVCHVLVHRTRYGRTPRD
jgi:hypothetical protein